MKAWYHQLVHVYFEQAAKFTELWYHVTASFRLITQLQEIIIGMFSANMRAFFIIGIDMLNICAYVSQLKN